MPRRRVRPASQPATNPSGDDQSPANRHEYWRDRGEGRRIESAEAGQLISIGDLVASIAHEINNPMAAVMGFSQLAIARESDPIVKGDLQKIFAQARKVSEIITSLQLFAGRRTPDMQPANASDILRSSLDLRSAELRSRNVEVTTRWRSEGAAVLCDRQQLSQAFLSVIDNAVQFMFEAHDGGALTAELVTISDTVVISFTDDGPGIPRKDLPKVFVPFFTTKEVGKGVGLGLSICHGIVQRHGGTVAVKSSRGQGTTVTIELPLLRKAITLPAV